MSSGGKGGNGGLRATETKGQDEHREQQKGRQVTHGVLVQIRKSVFPFGQMQHRARLQGLASRVQVGFQPRSPPCAVKSLHNCMRAVKADQPRNQSRHIQKTGSKPRKSRELLEMEDEWHCMRNALANIGK